MSFTGEDHGPTLWDVAEILLEEVAKVFNEEQEPTQRLSNALLTYFIQTHVTNIAIV